MDDFLEDLLTQTGAKGTMDPEVEAQLKADLLDQVTTMINRRLVDALTDEQAAQLDTLLEEQPNDAAAYQQFIIDNLPDKDQIVAAALYEFKALYLGNDA